MEINLPIVLGLVAAIECIVFVNGMLPSFTWATQAPSPAASAVDNSNNWKVYKSAHNCYRFSRGGVKPTGVNPETQPEVSTQHAPVVMVYGERKKVFLDGYEYTTITTDTEELDGNKEVKILEEHEILETINEFVFRKSEVNFTLMYAKFLEVLNNLYVKIPQDQRKAVLFPRTPEQSDYQWLTENISILGEHSKSPQMSQSDTGKLVETTLHDSQKSENQRYETQGLGVIEGECTKIMQVLEAAGFKVVVTPSNIDQGTRITNQLRNIGTVLNKQLIRGSEVLKNAGTHDSVVETLTQATTHIRTVIGNEQVAAHGTNHQVTSQDHDQKTSIFAELVKRIAELSNQLSKRMEGVERECTKIAQTLQEAGFKIDAPSTSDADHAARITAWLNHIGMVLSHQLAAAAGTTTLISDESHESSVIATITHATTQIREAIGKKLVTQHGHDNGVSSFVTVVKTLGDLTNAITSERTIYIHLLTSIVNQDFSELPWQHEAIDRREKIGVPLSDELQTMELSVSEYRETMYFTYNDVMAELRKCLVHNDDQQIRKLSGIGNQADHTSAGQLERLTKFLIKLSPHATAQPAVHRIVNLVRPWVIPFADKLGSHLSGIQPTLNEMASRIQHQKETPGQPEAGVHSNGVHSDGVH